MIILIVSQSFIYMSFCQMSNLKEYLDLDTYSIKEYKRFPGVYQYYVVYRKSFIVNFNALDIVRTLALKVSQSVNRPFIQLRVVLPNKRFE